MQLLNLLVLFVGITYTSAKLADRFTDPASICENKRYRCPDDELVQEYDEFLEKKYPDTTYWVSTSVSVADYGRNEKREMFMKLFRYIQGANEDGVKIPMTVPVTTKVIPGETAEELTTFEMSFYLADPSVRPAPTNPDVYLTELPPTTFYVRPFGGWTNNEKNMEHLQTLEEALENERKSFVTNEYYTTGYSSPWQLLNRRNEVWIRANE